MSHPPQPIAEEDLHSFVDNEMDDERCETVAAYLAATPADAARVEAWRQQNILLRAAFSQVALEQVPPSLSFTFSPQLVSLRSAPSTGYAARQGQSRRARHRTLAFSLAAFVGGICVTLAAKISINHYSAEQAGLVIASDGEELALLATSAVRKALPSNANPGIALNAPGAIEPALAILPALKAAGLQLVRGEIRSKPDYTANCLDFSDAAGTPVVLCIAAAVTQAEALFHPFTVASANAIYWHETASLYALAAPLNTARLTALARRIHVSLAAQRAYGPANRASAF